VRDLVSTRRVIIVPHGELNGVPFHALESGGRPLLLDHEVVQAPSASIHVHCRSARGRRSRSALLLGVPDETAPHIRDEIEDLARAVPNSRRFIGKTATEATLRRYGRHARLIHVAAHARFRHDDPMESGVLLADGWLTIPRIAELRLKPELLVLAGCATGRVSVTEGGELFGLIRGFLQAGASGLVTTLWPVPDTETQRFMKRFYAALEHGGPAAALRSAALSIREEQPHPFHWAPFVMMGAAR
jgi:CHAT domain-containing protein